MKSSDRVFWLFIGIGVLILAGAIGYQMGFRGGQLDYSLGFRYYFFDGNGDEVHDPSLNLKRRSR